MSIRIFRHLLLTIMAVTLFTFTAAQGVFAQATDPTVVIASGYVLPTSACQTDDGVTKTYCQSYVVNTRFIPRSQALTQHKDYVVLPSTNASKDTLIVVDRKIDALRDAEAKVIRATLPHLKQVWEYKSAVSPSCTHNLSQTLNWSPFSGTGGNISNQVTYSTNCTNTYILSWDNMTIHKVPSQPTYWCWDAYASHTYYASPSAWYMNGGTHTIYNLSDHEAVGYDYTVTVGQIDSLGNWCVGGLFPTPMATGYIVLPL